MAVTVTENPDPIRQNWQVPQNLVGVPVAAITWQGAQVAIGAATAEEVNITINGAFPRGFAYRMVEARVTIFMPDAASIDTYAGKGTLQFQTFDQSNPETNRNIITGLGSEPNSRFTQGGTANRTNGSSLPFTLLYEPQVPVTDLIFNATGASNTWQFATASLSDTTSAGELYYFFQALQYTIAEENMWAIHSPIRTV